MASKQPMSHLNINKNETIEQPVLVLTKKHQRQIENKVIQSLAKNQGEAMRTTNDLTNTTGAQNPVNPKINPEILRVFLKDYQGKVH